jgi:hypothetical protein
VLDATGQSRVILCGLAKSYFSTDAARVIQMPYLSFPFFFSNHRRFTGSFLPAAVLGHACLLVMMCWFSQAIAAEKGADQDPVKLLS